MGKVVDYLKERLAAFPSEVAQTVTDKVIPQGATEMAQALYSGQSNAFTPYGHAQQPLEVEGPAMSYQDTLRNASHGVEQQQDKGMDR